MEFTLPTGPWLKFGCDTGDTQPGYWWKTECGGRQIAENQTSTYTGPVNFTIKMRNELAGNDMTLFKGKMTVAKAHSNEVGPKAANKWVYFINHDWNLPIGYVYLTPDSLQGWDYPDFHIAFWVRGEPIKFQPHLFYQGKEVGKKLYEGMEVGAAGCEAEVENNTTHYVEDAVPQKAKWSRIECDFPNIKGANKEMRKQALDHCISWPIARESMSSNFFGTTNSRVQSNSRLHQVASLITVSLPPTSSAAIV
jgi:hypothetical protein